MSRGALRQATKYALKSGASAAIFHTPTARFYLLREDGAGPGKALAQDKEEGRVVWELLALMGKHKEEEAADIAAAEAKGWNDDSRPLVSLFCRSPLRHDYRRLTHRAPPLALFRSPYDSRPVMGLPPRYDLPVSNL